MKNLTANEKGKNWLKKETSPYYVRILLLSLLTVCSTVFSVLFAYTVKYLINSASLGQTKELWIFTGLILSFLLLKILLKTWEGYSAEKLRAKMTAQLRTKSFSKILRSDYAKVQKFHSGEMLTRLTTDIQEVSAYSVSLLPAVSGMVVQCLGAIFALFFIDPYFTLVYIFAGVIFASLTALFRKRLKKYQKEVLEADGVFRSYMQESFSSLLTVKAYSAEKQSTAKAEVLGNTYYTKRMKRNVLRSGMGGIFSLLSNFGLIFALVWCSIDVLHGSTDYGSILSSILLLMQLQTPLASFSSIPPAYYARQASGERLAEIDEIPIESCITEEKSEISYNTLKQIRFENVEFSYDRDVILSNMNAVIEKGKIICLTGASGSGKSTIFKLLLNIFSPTAGSITVEDTTQSAKLTSSTRGLFAYVPQGNFLFSGTIYENLTFFTSKQEESLQEKIKTALQVACADFVFSLPQGLDTVLTERGGGLSEGQLQRLAVARALLSDRPILLLDEATSALDPETETALLQNLKKLKDKTCLIVTHRPAALAIADEVIHLENGNIQYIEKTER